MKLLGTLCTLALFLFLIAPTKGYSQDENKPQQQDEQKSKDNNKAKENDRGKQDEKAKPEEKTARPDEGKRNEAPNAGRQEDRQTQPEANRPQEEQRNQQRNEGRDQHPAEQQRPMENNQHAMQDNGRDQNHGGNRGRQIPEEQFRSHFGREHHFHVQRDRVVNVSQPVVVYGGYSWQLAEPWPSAWSYDDDCYIDEVDGEYFLFDALHPGLRIAVFLAD
jgi:hypothetical protein